MDDASGQPFYKGRIGLTGLGFTLSPEAHFAPAEQVGNVGSYSGFDKGAKSDGANVSAGLSAGIGIVSFDAKLVTWNPQLVTVEKADGSKSFYHNDKGPEFFTGDISYLFSDKHDIPVGGGKGNAPKIGININLDANYEFGSLVPWSDIFNDGKPYE